MAIELVSFDDLKVFLELSKTEVDYPHLTLIQESVVDAIEQHLDRSLESDNYVETKSLFCGPVRMIKLQALPVTAVSSVVIDGVTSTEYKIRPWGIELNNTADDVDVVVSYTGGIEDVPGNLKRAALLQTVYEFQNKESIGIETVSTEGGTVVKPELGLLKEVIKLLALERHPYPVF